MSFHVAADRARADAGERDERARTAIERGPAASDVTGTSGHRLAPPAALIFGLQRTAGNAAVVQLLRRPSASPRFVQREPGPAASGTDENAEAQGAGEATELPTPLSSGEGAGEAAAAAGGTEGAGGADGGAGGTDGGAGGTEGTAATGAQAGEGEAAATSGEAGASAAQSAAGESAGSGEGSGSSESTGSSEGAGAAEEAEQAGAAGAAEGAEGAESSGAGEAGASGADAGAAEGAEGGEAADGEHSQEDQDRKEAEGEGETLSDPEVPMEGGPPPAVPVLGGFHDLGRRATVPFGSAEHDTADAEDATHPHAYTGGGRTGGAAWAGGGKGKGPKGNQGTGSLQAEVKPDYDSRSNGLRSNADAWVKDGTGKVDVSRDYITSDAGDQGNGWWISSKAAASLEAHEQRHVASSKELYENDVQPMLDRVANSATLGKGLSYWSSDAKALLSQKIGWATALKKFKEDDIQSNSDQGLVDSADYGSSHYPRNMKGPRTIGGKQYDNFLIMGDEPDPT